MRHFYRTSNYQIDLVQSDRASKVSCVTLLWLLHCLLHRHLTSITSLPTPTKFSVYGGFTGWLLNRPLHRDVVLLSTQPATGVFFWGNAIHTWTQWLVQEVPKPFHPARGSQVGNPKLSSFKAIVEFRAPQRLFLAHFHLKFALMTASCYSWIHYTLCKWHLFSIYNTFLPKIKLSIL